MEDTGGRAHTHEAAGVCPHYRQELDEMFVGQRIEYKDAREVTQEAWICGSDFSVGLRFILVVPLPTWVR